MAWARVDDAFDDHPKVLALLEFDDGVTAVGLWTLCLTWAHRNTRRGGKTPGRIPGSLPRRYLGPQGKDIAALLVKVGLWEVADDGWQIHDFENYLPSDETRAARSEAGKRGAAKRWGDKKSQPKSPEPDPEWQGDSNLPSGSHDDAGNSEANDGSRAGAHRAIPNGIAPTPAPKPENQNLSSEADAPDPDPESTTRDDVERLCTHLADRIEGNGSKRPLIGKKWRDAARLLIDADGRTEQQVHTAIDWCQNDEWWRSRVMSMPKLREKYDQLRLQATSKQARGTPKAAAPPTTSPRNRWLERE